MRRLPLTEGSETGDTGMKGRAYGVRWRNTDTPPLWYIVVEYGTPPADVKKLLGANREIVPDEGGAQMHAVITRQAVLC